MNKRWLYVLLFSVPGLAAALILAALATGAAAGGLWLFVYGDNPWPPLAGALLPVLFGLAFLAVWGACLVWGYAVGKRQEAVPGLNRRHLWIAAGVTLVLLALIALQQLRTGNLGAKPESLLCSDFCGERGYAASGLSPRDAGERICSCFDAGGREAVTIGLDRLREEL